MEAQATQTINLLLVDDHAMFREGLARVLEKEPGIKVVAQCGSAAWQATQQRNSETNQRTIT